MRIRLGETVCTRGDGNISATKDLNTKAGDGKKGDETMELSRETIDLTQSTSSSGDQIETPRKNGHTEGIRKSNRQSVPLSKYGGIPYSTRFKNR